MKNIRFKSLITIFVAMVFLCSCSSWREAKVCVDVQPSIFPDYIGVTVPCNIAPLNFMIEDAEHIQADFSVDGSSVLRTVGKDGVLHIDIKEWQHLLSVGLGKTVEVAVSVWNKDYPEGAGFKPFTFDIAKDNIDSHIVYRLIEPSYIEFRQLGIYQRNISTFEEEAIVTNRNSLTTCVNCHTFSSYSPENIMFHVRGADGGTFIYHNGEATKIDFTKIGLKKNTTYPSWHPGGRFIAFSSNKTHQIFYTEGRQQIEVFDIASDLLVYDIETGDAITDPRFSTEDVLETFPSWSPDGKDLYFVTHKAANLPVRFSPDMHYDLVKVSFDAKTKTFGSQVDTIYNTRIKGGSVSHPRISPDGKYILYTLADYGTFPIWHNEADLQMIDLNTGENVDISVWNTTDFAESYHSWSSNGRWVVFGSRRMDGRFTHLYIGYLGEDGKPCKPFLLPQEDPLHNQWRLKSYNVPELISGKVELPKDMNPIE